ncbi:hypothetical protein [Rhodococcus sovatensis]|uniref:Luciferase domain-containing protein n=1 Tax=Rhodococcus sovatensis TaxID=1805840 RepID=A0ABZ2PKV8_9NOCA
MGEAAIRYIKRDYSTWTALGPGGLPSNPFGWVVTTILRAFKRPDPLTVRGASNSSNTWTLEPRLAPRPFIAPHPVPHRQLSGHSTPSLIHQIGGVIADEARRNDSLLHLGRSRLERRGDALYLSDPSLADPNISRTQCEIAHVHGSDGSLHVVMTEDDAQTVISAGWGELHPLAGRPLIGLPESYVLIYAPTSDHEVNCIAHIVRRAVHTACITGPCQ